ncbi:MAG TPA: hypothetical protein VF767_05745 [Bryobacteraceae bacterium]
MKDLRLFTASAVLAALLFAPSCRLFRKSTAVPPPPPPPPAPTETEPASAPAEKPKQVSIPTPPEISPQHPDLTQPSPSQVEGKLPPPPRKRRHTRSAHTREVPPEQAGEPAAPTPPPAPAAAPEETALPVPQVEQIFTPEQRQSYLDEIEANIGRAQRVVDSVQSRALTREQKTDVARIREFIAQAKDAREADLFRARNLAERASILAQDLNRSLQ